MSGEKGDVMQFPGNPNAAPGAEQGSVQEQPIPDAAGEPGAVQEQPIPDQDEGGGKTPAEGDARPETAQGSADDCMSLEDRRKYIEEAMDKFIEDEDKELLAEMKAGEVRILKREGSARHCARKILDAVTGLPSIDRFVEYGTNPFHVVYFMPEQVMIEAAGVAGGVMVRYNGAMAFIPRAHLEPAGDGFVRIAK